MLRKIGLHIYIFILTIQLTCAHDLYAVLGVSRSDSPSVIKNAYRKLVKKWHPDKNKDLDAGKRFIEIQKAYEILGDPNKKMQYDNFGKFQLKAGVHLLFPYNSIQGTYDEGEQPPQRGFNNDFMHMFHFGEFGRHPFFEMPSQNNFFSKHKLDLRYYKSSLQSFITCRLNSTIC